MMRVFELCGTVSKTRAMAFDVLCESSSVWLEAYD